MLRYPVDISEETPGQFIAKLADAPDGPAGRGDSAAAAFRSLMDPAITYLTKLMMKGQNPAASPAGERPVIGVDMPQRLLPTWKPDVLFSDKYRGRMLSYAWTQNITYRDR